ncbi:MAG: hypothetical protein AAFV25_23360 [Bacteroidota bacterium]
MFPTIDDWLSRFISDPQVASRKQIARSMQARFKARKKFDNENAILRSCELFVGKKGKRLVSVIQPPSTVAPKVRFRIYDYLYYGDLGKKQTTVLEFFKGDIDLSPFIIRPRKFVDAVRDIFVQPPSRLFATTPEFDDHYQLEAIAPEEIKFDLNEDFLDDIGDVPDWTYEGKANFLIAYQPGKRLSDADVLREWPRFELICEKLIKGQSKASFV